MHTKSAPFFPNLDGLRFFCFLSVFLFHSFATDYTDVQSNGFYQFVKYFLAGNGDLGINFFFVLSGFLITYLLLVEKEQYGNINVGNFYVRRILRIWPLFYPCVIFGFFVFPAIKQALGAVPAETAHLCYYLTFLNNFDYIKYGTDSSTLSILWSVAVEEQFYFFWPLLVFIFPVRYLNYLFLVILTASFAFRFIHSDDPLILEFHSLSCISDMTIGATAALFATSRKKQLTQWIGEAPKLAWGLLYTCVTLCFLFRKDVFGHAALTIAADRLLISVLFALVILEQNFANHSLFKVSRLRTISTLGKYTYGMYCVHMIAILIAAKALSALAMNNTTAGIIFLEGGLALLITIFLAIVSFYFYESKFLRLKVKFMK